MGKESYKKCDEIIKKLFENRESQEFRAPVDYVSKPEITRDFGLYDYPVIIKKPMDLSTCKLNLKQGQYKTVEDCLADLQLIWENCKLYNDEASVGWV